MGRTSIEEIMMAKYLLLKHYRGAPAPVNNVPMDQWAPEEISDHIQYMRDFATRLEETGEFVDAQALAPEGTWVRYDGEGRSPVTDGPFAETKDLIAGWMVIDVDSHERALELAGTTDLPSLSTRLTLLTSMQAVTANLPASPGFAIADATIVCPICFTCFTRWFVSNWRQMASEGSRETKANLSRLA
jgi:hypothetical protein